MQKFLSFLSYHNAVPAALVVIALGAGGALAATTTGVIPVPTVFQEPEISIPPELVEIDVSTLLSADLSAFDFRPTVTGVIETGESYTVSYAIFTLAPEDAAWAAYEKTGEFSVAKDALDDTGLRGYVVAKLRDLENQERDYLARAQEAEKKLADTRTARPANAFAALIGLALNQIHVPVVEKPVPQPTPMVAVSQPQTPPPQESAPVLTTQAVTEDFASSTAVSTNDITSTESADIATTTSVFATTTQASDTTLSTSDSNTTATSTTLAEQDTGSAAQAETSTTTSPTQ